MLICDISRIDFYSKDYDLNYKENDIYTHFKSLLQS